MRNVLQSLLYLNVILSIFAGDGTKPASTKEGSLSNKTMGSNNNFI